MTVIRPSSDLRNKYSEMSSLCKEEGAVYITVNGRDDTVLVSQEKYDADQAKLELYELLAESEEDLRMGRMKVLEDVTGDILQRVEGICNEGKKL